MNQGAGQIIIRRSHKAIVIRIVLVGDAILGLNKGTSVKLRLRLY